MGGIALGGEQRVGIAVEAESTGEEAYRTHATGVREVTTAMEQATAATDRHSESSDRSAAKLMALQGALLSVVGGMRRLNLLTDEQVTGLLQVVGVVQTVVGVYRLLSAEALKTAATLWAKAIARIAASGPAAPFVLAAIGGAVAGALALKAASGLQRGTPEVTEAGIFRVGEGGEETVFLPRGAAVAPAPIDRIGGGSTTFNNYIVGEPAAWGGWLQDQYQQRR